MSAIIADGILEDGFSEIVSMECNYHGVVVFPPSSDQPSAFIGTSDNGDPYPLTLSQSGLSPTAGVVLQFESNYDHCIAIQMAPLMPKVYARKNGIYAGETRSFFSLPSPDFVGDSSQSAFYAKDFNDQLWIHVLESFVQSEDMQSISGRVRSLPVAYFGDLSGLLQTQDITHSITVTAGYPTIARPSFGGSIRQEDHKLGAAMFMLYGQAPLKPPYEAGIIEITATASPHPSTGAVVWTFATATLRGITAMRDDDPLNPVAVEGSIVTQMDAPTTPPLDQTVYQVVLGAAVPSGGCNNRSVPVSFEPVVTGLPFLVAGRDYDSSNSGSVNASLLRTIGAWYSDAGVVEYIEQLRQISWTASAHRTGTLSGGFDAIYTTHACSGGGCLDVDIALSGDPAMRTDLSTTASASGSMIDELRIGGSAVGALNFSKSGSGSRSSFAQALFSEQPGAGFPCDGFDPVQLSWTLSDGNSGPLGSSLAVTESLTGLATDSASYTESVENSAWDTGWNGFTASAYFNAGSFLLRRVKVSPTVTIEYSGSFRRLTNKAIELRLSKISQPGSVPLGVERFAFGPGGATISGYSDTEKPVYDPKAGTFMLVTVPTENHRVALIG